MKRSILPICAGILLGILPALLEWASLNFRIMFIPNQFQLTGIYYWPGVKILEILGIAWQGAASGKAIRLAGGPLAVLAAYLHFHLIAGIIYSIILSIIFVSFNFLLKKCKLA